MNVCLLIPFYGKWPSYFHIFLKGAAQNPWLDIIFLTDLELPTTTPENVKKVESALSNLESLIQSRLSLSVRIFDPYKLCDFRPAYGHLFSEMIQAYDFWGFGDIDLVYGNVGHFIQQQDLLHYDVISCREKWLSGSFALLRNTEYVNNLFRHGDFRSVFANPEFMGFDECAREWHRLLAGTSIFELEPEKENFTLILKREESKGNIKLLFRDCIRESLDGNTCVFWRNGKITDLSDREYLHFHYVLVKRKPYFLFPAEDELAADVVITATGFYSYQQYEGALFPFLNQGRRLKAIPSLLWSRMYRCLKKYIKWTWFLL